MSLTFARALWLWFALGAAGVVGPAREIWAEYTNYRVTPGCGCGDCVMVRNLPRTMAFAIIVVLALLVSLAGPIPMVRRVLERTR